MIVCNFNTWGTSSAVATVTAQCCSGAGRGDVWSTKGGPETRVVLVRAPAVSARVVRQNLTVTLAFSSPTLGVLVLDINKTANLNMILCTYK